MLYEVAAAEVSDDTASSAIIQRIMAISAATAACGALEAGLGAEEDNDKDEGVFTDANSGPDEDGTVLAGANLQSSVDNAPSTEG